jgi:hypothetical protein
LFTYISGCLITLVSLIAEPVLSFLSIRRKDKQYATLEWTTNESLQLHRLAHQELEMGNWSGCSDHVPMTEPDDLLANLDISDVKHPVLSQPGKTAPAEEKARLDDSTQASKED